MKFKAIQAIQAKSTNVYDFLQKQKLFNLKNIYFVRDESWYHEPLLGTALCILTQSGQMLAIQGKDKTFTLNPIHDVQFILKCVALAQHAVNVKQECLRPTLEQIEKSLGLREDPVALF